MEPNIKFTAREIEILNCAAKARTRSQASEDLTISVKTPDTHLKSIYAKSNTKNYTQLVAFAINNGYGKEE